MPKISVCYATPEQQVEIPLSVEKSCTLALAIRRSGLLVQFPEIELATITVGVWSKKAALDDLVSDGDRVEVYRPLVIDPKAARLLRAKKLLKPL